MSVVIVGGGIAGLACGCYLQMNGYSTQILEAKSVVGGLCVAWERGPYLFDGCMRWLVGTDSLSSFSQVWRELRAIGSRRILSYEEFLRVECENGASFSFTSDLDRFAADAKAISPSDSRRIDALVKAARSCADLDPPLKPLELMSPWEKTRLLVEYFPMLMTVARWKGTSIADYVRTYESPVLREILGSAAGDPRMSVIVLIMLLGIRGRDNVGYVTGGSRALISAIHDYYTALGGRVVYHCEVERVRVDKGRATGVRCKSRQEIQARHVVSCVDGHTAIYGMLEGKFLNQRLRRLYEQGEVFPSLVQVSLGIGRALNQTSESVSLPMPKGISANGQDVHSRLELSLLADDCELCPPGKTVVLARFASHPKYWTELKAKDPRGYETQKRRVRDAVIEFVERRFPGSAQAIESSDVATPATFIRYTNNRDGSCQGWLPTPGVLDRPIPQTLPGLKNFYMAGHWVQAGGGLPPAALSARYVAQLICARDRQPFRTACA